MKTHDLIQGSPQWHAHRAQFRNASDAPAMMGCSPYESRSALLHRIATGITKEVDAGTQRRFDDGHKFEALARPLGAAIIGEDLYPVVGSEGTLSASFDGLPMVAPMAWEHKSLNDALRAVLPADGVGDWRIGASLPMVYRVQLEQQHLVAGDLDAILFTASKWDGETLVEARHCWYHPDPELAQSILDGWDQFARDLATYVPPSDTREPVTAKKIDTLPALRVDVTGMVTASNLDEFKTVALTAIRAVNRDLKTDQDFADAAEAVKWCADVESRLKAAKEHILGQTGSIDAALKVMDDIADEARRTRLDVDKTVTNRKEQIRADIITKARGEFKKHTDELQAEIKGATLACVIPDFAQAAKGKRTVDTMQDAVDTLMAQAKIGANVAAKVLRDGLACITEHGAGFDFLFADRAGLAGKPLDDLRVLVKARIDAHLKAEEAKKSAVVEQPAPVAAPAPAPAPAPSVVTLPIAAAPPAAHEAATLNIGAINARLAVMKIDAAGMASLGIEPAEVKGAAKTYTESQFRLLCMRLQLTLGKLLRDEVAA